MTSAASQFRPRDRRPVYEWAASHVHLRAPYTITGAFDVSISRHFLAPFEALQDDHCREVNILKPVRGGGTLIADVWCPWTRSNDPGPFMYVLQTDAIADDHSYRKAGPLIKSVAPIADMLRGIPEKKISLNSIEFADGNTFQINGPSISNLQTNAFRYLVLDECWLYDLGRMADAEGRVGDYLKLQLSKILRVSQAGPREGRTLEECDWHRSYHAASVHEWEVECQSCHKHFIPLMGAQRQDGSYWGLTWDKHKLANGDWDVAKCAPTVRFDCEHCNHPHTDCHRTQREWNRTGRYRLTTEANRKKQSFHWSALIDFPWTELAELWLHASNAFERGEIMPRLQFHQKRLAQFMDEERLLKKGLNLHRVALDTPALDGMRVMAVDRQDEDKFWWSVNVWSQHATRRIAFGMCYGFVALEELRKKHGVEPHRLLIDSGYQPKGDRGVYGACVHYGWIAVKGDRERSYTHRDAQGRTVMRSYAPMVWKDAEIGRAGKRLCRLIRYSKDAMNQAVQSLIDSQRWEEPVADPGDAMESEYNAQMASRVRKSEYNARTGETKVFWRESKNDHARDLANIQCLAGILLKLMPDPAMEMKTETETHGATTA